jgi:hypothetical protein
MSVEIETSAQSMSESLNSLRVTPSPMHRIYMKIGSVQIWYKIMREANALYGRNWRGQSGVKRRLDRTIWDLGNQFGNQHQVVCWFEVPDEKFGTWVALKYAVSLVAAPGK